MSKTLYNAAIMVLVTAAFLVYGCLFVSLAVLNDIKTPPTPEPTQIVVVVTVAPAPMYVAPIRQPSHPSGATALCNDGTYSYSANRRGTCSHHGGVAIWLR